MAEISKFWITVVSSPVGDQTTGYSAIDEQDILRTTLTIDPTIESVVAGELNELAVAAGSGLVSVATGYGLCNGLWYFNGSSFNHSIPTPTTATRKDRIVLCANLTGSAGTPPNGVASQPAYSVRVVRLTQSEGVATDVAVTQNSSWWQVPLASVSITTGAVITVTDQRKFLRSPGIKGAVDDSSLEWGSGTIRVKASGLQGTHLNPNFSFPGQFTYTLTGLGPNAAIKVSSSVPAISLNETDVSADERLWGFAVNGKALYGQTLSDDGTTSVVNWLQVTRGTGSVVNAINLAATAIGLTGATTLAGTVLITGATSAAAITGTGQIKSTLAGVASGAGLVASSASPAVGLVDTAQTTDEKAWDVISVGKKFYIRAMNDAGSGGVIVMEFTRGTGTAVTGIAFPGTAPVTMGGALTVTGNITGNTSGTHTGAVVGNVTGNVTGNADTATTVANDAITNAKLANMSAATVKGQIVGGSGDPVDMTPTQALAVLGIQRGQISLTSAAAGALSSTVTITFSPAFASAPYLVLTPFYPPAGDDFFAIIATNSASSATVVVSSPTSGSGLTVFVNWIAIP